MTNPSDMSNEELAWKLEFLCGPDEPWHTPDYASEAASRLRAMEWQPIETAPKDGTWFWGKVDDDAISMCWHSGFEDFVSSWRRMTMAPGFLVDGKSEKDHSPEVYYPKLWMPLPPAPKGE